MSRAFKIGTGALTPWPVAAPAAPARPLTVLGGSQRLVLPQVPATQPFIPVPPPVTTPSIWRSDGPALRPASRVAPSLFRTSAFPLRTPTAVYNFHIYGITKDSAGAALAGCVVKLYRTSDDALMQQTISGADGSYEFRCTSQFFACYIVAYLAGSPDVAGTTVNTLLGT